MRRYGGNVVRDLQVLTRDLESAAFNEPAVKFHVRG